MPQLIRINEENAAIQPAIILIPDISGFTEYMHTSENMHCRYIVSELIELILDSNRLDLAVSELEGDAVLFYKFGKPPPLEKLIDQCTFIFKKFHEYLIQFNSDRLCGCKCCEQSKNLSIKFIVHYGKVSPVNIKHHKKLFGADMIAAHKLLKNNLKCTEYILITDSYLSTQRNNDLNKVIKWENAGKGKIDYDHVGEISYSFIQLSELKEDIVFKRKSSPEQKENNPVKFKIYINVPPHFVKEIITDFKFKPNWITILHNISYNERAIPRIGATHRCIMSDIFFKPIVIDYQSIFLSEDNLTYVEKLTNKFIDLNAVLYFHFEERGFGTVLNLELHLIHTDFYTGIIKMLFKRKSSKRRIRSSLLKLKYLCESIYNKYN